MNEAQEIWKPIDGYESLYEVSNLGRVRSLDKPYLRRDNGATYIIPGRVLACGRNGEYRTVTLHKEYGQKTFSVHRLVAKAFLPQKEGQICVNHLDSNPSNNRADNLEWCTQSHNIQYAYDNGTKVGPHMRDVDQLSLNGEYIRTWHGLAPAARAIGCFPQNIVKVCAGKRDTAGGFKWRYTGQ